MPWFVGTETYEKEVEGPDGDKATVKYRRLNAGDQIAIQDTLRMEIGEGANPSMALGTMRMLTVSRAVIDWNIPGPKPTAETLASLDPDVFDQIYAHIEMGAETLPTKEDSEEEETPASEDSS